MQEPTVKQKILLLVIDKLVIGILIALVAWYIEARMKILDSQLSQQREQFVSNIKTENEKNLKRIDQIFQMQQQEQRQNFEFSLERFKSNLNYANDTEKNKIENRKKLFARLMSLKIPWTQYYRTNLEAKMLSEFYERRYQLFTHNVTDLEESKRQYNRGLDIIKEITNTQRDVIEVLGLVEVYYNVNKNLKIALSDLYNFKSVDVPPFPLTFKSEAELDAHFKSSTDVINIVLQREYIAKIEAVITHLRSQH